MDKVEKVENLKQIIHKDFDEFIKGKGVTGRNSYKLRELKAMFGFRPMVTISQVTVSLNDGEPSVYDFISKASVSTGVPYSTLLCSKRKLKATNINPVVVKSNGNKCTIKFATI